MSKKQENAVVEVQSGAIVAGGDNLPEWLKKGSNRGSENVEASDLILPRIGQIQALSPQIKKSDAQFIEGAEQGMFFNTLTSELLGTEITFIPVLFRKEWVVFRDRKSGGGFFGAFPTERESLDFIEKHETPAGLESIESHNHIGVMLLPNGDRQQIVFTCTKSKIKASRKLNSMVAMAGVDRFAKAYNIKSVEAENNAGDDYWNVDVRPVGYVTQEVHGEMEALYESLKSLNIKTDYSDQNAGSGDGRPAFSAEEEKEF